jgi:hypothetical protein
VPADYQEHEKRMRPSSTSRILDFAIANEERRAARSTTAIPHRADGRLLGEFTTFSSFGWETFSLAHGQVPGRAARATLGEGDVGRWAVRACLAGVPRRASANAPGPHKSPFLRIRRTNVADKGAAYHAPVLSLADADDPQVNRTAVSLALAGS